MSEPKYAKPANNLNKASTVLTVVVSAFDIYDTWSADNNNTNGQRVIKTAIQIGGIAVGVGVGYLAAAGGSACAAAGPVAVGVVTFGISVAGGFLISATEDALYKSLGIE